MATRTIVIKLNRLATEPILTATDQGSDFVYYIVPGDTILNVDDIESPRRSGFTRYTGNMSALSTDCGVVAPGTGLPVFILSSLPSALAGANYKVVLNFNEVGTPAAGKTIESIDYPGGVPSWMVPTLSIPNRTLTFEGTPPAGLSSFTLTLRLNQSDNKTANKTYTVAVVAATLFASARYDPSTDRILVHSGPEAGETNRPVLTDTDASGKVTGPQQMRPFTATVNGTEAAYIYEGATGPAKGQHVLKIEHLGQTKYATFTVGSSDTDYVALTLTDAAPVVTTPTTPATGAVVAVDAQWIRTRTGDPYTENRIHAWYNVSEGDDLVLYYKTDGAYQLMGGNKRIASDPKGYTHKFDINSYTGQVHHFKFKAASQPDSAFREVSFTVPTGASLTTTRVQIDPVVTPPTTGGSTSDDPAISIDFSSEDPTSINYYKA